MNNIDDITNLLDKIIEYIDLLYPDDGFAKDNAITRLSEAIFWITYMEERND